METKVSMFACRNQARATWLGFESAVVGVCLDSDGRRRFETGDRCPFRNRLDERRVGTRGTVLPCATEYWIAMANWKLS
jgi:hypothetical protein